MANYSWEQEQPTYSWETGSTPAAVDITGDEPSHEELLSVPDETPEEVTEPSVYTEKLTSALQPYADLIEGAAGITEAGVTMATGFAAAVPATVMGLADAVQKKDVGEFVDTFKAIQNKFTYEPRGEYGKAALGFIEGMFEKYSESVDKYIVQPNLENENEILAIIGKVAGEGLPILLPVRKVGELSRPKELTQQQTETAHFINNELVNIARDTREFEQLKSSLVKEEVIEKPAIGERPPKVETKQVALKEDAPSMLASAFDPHKLLPSKFIGDKYPIVKWVADRLDKDRISTELLVEDLFYRPETKIVGNKPKNIPTREGGMTVWETLSSRSTKEAADVVRAMDEFNKPGRAAEVSVSVLQRRGISPEGIEAYKATRNMLERSRTLVNLMGRKYGGKAWKDIPKEAGYYPHIFTGEHRVLVKSKATGEVLEQHAGDSKGAALRMQKDMQSKLGKRYDIEYWNKERGTSKDDPAAAFAEAIWYLNKKEQSPIASELSKIFEDYISTKGFGKHRLQRKGVRGFKGDPRFAKSDKQLVKDMDEVLRTYVEGAARFAYNMKSKHHLNKLLADPAINKLYPNQVGYSRMLADHYVSKRGFVDEMLYKAKNAGRNRCVARNIG